MSPRCVRAVTCLYTVTPGFGFVIDRHPEWERVLVASPCSGHGFKHSAAIGEAIAERVIDRHEPARPHAVLAGALRDDRARSCAGGP